ncbi:Myb-like DNA-binding domain containing protein [Tritrichomonas foetus]|uniref:Myb-like DNA-binding domain containing protein n=1 Tax=Tritrichomonas foetus TaxID=1144522 RepID=A0A1J4J9Y5_9EUKA|nr:Myb-like DNA-binding domain containing protein [Tritrichomonas foetus]|eukprot:OHS96002.1 Myb-like DNA-binding domain containing protein [Tritrichomonas foetus]
MTDLPSHLQEIKRPRKNPIFKQHFKWTPQEDLELIELVKRFGDDNWRYLAKSMNGRNSRQCRERWQYYLNPNLKKDEWTEDEDNLILSKFIELGPRWMQIAKFFEHRTDAMIKNRYHVLQRIMKKEKEIHNNDVISQKKEDTEDYNELDKTDEYFFCDNFEQLIHFEISDSEDPYLWDTFDDCNFMQI